MPWNNCKTKLQWRALKAFAKFSCSTLESFFSTFENPLKLPLNYIHVLIWALLLWEKETMKKTGKPRPSSIGGTRSLPVTPHCLQSPKWLLWGPKIVDRVWKGILPKVFGCPHQLLQNMVIDPSTPTLRKVEDGEEKKIMAELVATNVVSSWSPERRPTGTPTARANYWTAAFNCQQNMSVERLKLSPCLKPNLKNHTESINKYEYFLKFLILKSLHKVQLFWQHKGRIFLAMVQVLCPSFAKGSGLQS